MGVEMLSRPVFAASVERSAAFLRELGCTWEPVAELRRSERESRLGRPDVSQPICTVLQIALVDELRAWGVRPVRVVGHSSGEIGAAYCLGALTHRDAITAAFLRGQVSAGLGKATPGRQGGMMAVGCSREDAEEIISTHDIGGGQVNVACVNSPSSVTISGDAAALTELSGILEKRNISARRLKVEMAYHSPLMNTVSGEYSTLMAGIEPRTEVDESVSMISSLTGCEVVPEMLGPYYWVGNLLSPVLFSDAVRELVRPSDSDTTENTVDMFVEIGPHSTLTGPVAQILDHYNLGPIPYKSIMVRSRDSSETTLQLAQSLFHHGVPLNLSKANGDPHCKLLTDLPPYPWKHDKPYNATSRLQKEYLHRPFPPKSLIGAHMPMLNQTQHVWRGFLRLDDEPWLRGHKVGETVLLPGAGMLVMAIEAARQLTQGDAGKTVHAFRLREVSFFAALALAEGGATEVTTTLRPHLVGAGGQVESAWWEFVVSSSVGMEGLRDHCRGLLSVEYKEGRSEQTECEDAHIRTQRIADYHRVRSEYGNTNTYDETAFYDLQTKLGFHYGADFRTIQAIRPGPGKATFGVRLSDISTQTFSQGQIPNARPFLAHAAALDAVFQSWTCTTYHDGALRSEKPYAPTYVGEMEISAGFPAPGGQQVLPGVCFSEGCGFNEISASTFLFDEGLGGLVLSAVDFRISELEAAGVGVGDVGDEVGLGAAVEITSRVRWNWAFDVIWPEEMAEVVCAATTSVEDRLLEVVRVVLHENPASSVLEPVPNYASLPEAVLNSAQSRSGLLREVISPACRVHYAVLEGNNQDEHGHFQQDSDEHIHGQAFALGEPDTPLPADVLPTDLLIIPPSSSNADSSILERLATLVKPNATIVLASSSPAAVSVFEAREFKLFVNIPSGNGVSVALYRGLGKQLDHESPDQDVVIIVPSTLTKNTQDFSAVLQERLVGHGKNVVCRNWAEITTGETFTGKSVISLVELDHPILENPTASDFQTIKTIILQSERLLWITRGDDPSVHVVDGLARCVRNEIGGIKFQILHLSEASGLQYGPELAARLAAREQTRDNEFREVWGVLQVARVFKDAEGDERLARHLEDSTRVVPLREQGDSLRLTIGRPGLLDTLRFVKDGSMDIPLADDEVEIEIKAAGLNFKDVMAAMGMIPMIPISTLGCEASGIILQTAPTTTTRLQKGDRVAVLCPAGTHTTRLRTAATLVTKIPDALTLEQAASIPIIFATAYHALINTAKLQRGQSVLIHAAAGGVGQAAVQLALHLGLVVYATVGSEDKRKFLTERYGIPGGRIFNSRDASFAKGISRVTGGRGVDCVLNSLSGELLSASWGCVALFGTFVEIGLRDVANNMRLEMRPFRKNVSFTFFDIKDIPEKKLAAILDEVFELFRRGCLETVSPLSMYPFDQVEEAYRVMQQGKHRGKIILSFSEDTRAPVLCRAADSLRLDPEATYLLLGGLGGLGRSLARLFVACGARNIVFISRSGGATPTAANLITELESQGTRVKALSADIADENSLLKALTQLATDLPPIRGVVHLATVLRDNLFEKLSHEDWTVPLGPKLHGSRNLHNYFDHTRPLDFFVLCSSVSCIWGHATQSGYAAANTYQDALAHHRRARGLKGVAVNLGIIRDIGMAAEREFGAQFEVFERVLGIRGPVFLALMKSVIRGQMENEDFPAQVCSGLGSAASWRHDRVPRFQTSRGIDQGAGRRGSHQRHRAQGGGIL